MKNKGYVICKIKKKKVKTILNKENIKAFKFKPLNNVNYPGIKVDSLIIVNSSFIEKILKKKIKRKLDLFVKFMINVIEEDDSDSDDVVQALNELYRYRSVIMNKYKKFLNEKYLNLLMKKFEFLEKELKNKVMVLEEEYEYEETNTSKRTR